MSKNIFINLNMYSDLIRVETVTGRSRRLVTMDRKVKVEVFIPTGACACTWQSFMDKVWAIVLKFKDYVDFQVKPAFSDEALKYGLTSTKAVVVNGSTKMSEYTFNAQRLEEAIRLETEK
jgi:hypothetical protein